ncbi:MAG TPA: hypothetical protein VFI91_14120 [Longimicrobiaceae bacterium]|nr:hypothetical protein [Longimicrobiaceae bacterium]
MPLWLQRLPSDVRRRLDLAEAAAIVAREETHAQQALNLVAVMAPRMPFDEAIERYIEIMSLGRDEAESVHNRALVALSDPDTGANLARERHRPGWGLNWRYVTPLGAVRFVQRKMRRNAEEDLWMELSAARAEEGLVRTHIQHAMIFAEILDEHVPAPRSVSVYIDRLEVPTTRARAVYQRVLARLADMELPRLPSRYSR